MAAHLDGLSARHAYACRARTGRLSVHNAASPLCRTVPAARRALLTSLNLSQSCPGQTRSPYVLVRCTQHPNRQETTDERPTKPQEDSSDPITSPESTPSSSSKNTKQQPTGASPPSQSSIPPHRHQQQRQLPGPLAWFQRLTSDPKSNFPLRVLFNLAVLWVLMRLWPAGRSLHGEGSDELLVKIAYSDFVRAAKANEVQLVTVDGLKVFFSLRPNSPTLMQRRQLHQQLSSGSISASATATAEPATTTAAAPSSSKSSPTSTSSSSSRSRGSSKAEPSTAADSTPTPTSTPAVPAHTMYFYTVRPADYEMPYRYLEDNAVPVSAIEHRDNPYLTLLGYTLLAVLVLSTLNRLPLKAQPKGPGRKHRPAGGPMGGFGGLGGGGGGAAEGGPVTTTFADVAGVDEAKEELQEIVEYLRAPERFSRLGARPPAGVLLVGPPGTGKTLLAKAVAGEAGVPFFSISASEFVELYVGMGAMRVRELFAAARREAPAIVFIDEIDAVAKGRDMRLRSVGNDEREQTLNQLLTELDGFDSGGDTRSSPTNTSDPQQHPAHNVVICIAATNRPDVLDPALLRPGRFDRRVSVERPDRVGREQILRVHLQRRGLPLSDDVCVSWLAATTTGFTGADLANLVNEAALLGGRRGKAAVGREEFDAAIMRAVAGIEKKRSILQGTEKAVVARHEVGHALVGAAVARLLATGFSEPSRLSIIPRTGGALGFTYTPPKSEDRALLFDSEIRGQLAVLLGGRAAEHLTCGAVSTGAADDIRRATDLATRAVTEFGLSAAVGPIHVGVLTSGGAEGDVAALLKDGGDMGRVVEREVRELVEGALTVAMHVVAVNREVHSGLSGVLLDEERVEGDDLATWLRPVQVPSSLRQFVLEGRLPDRAALGLSTQPAASAAIAAAAAAGGLATA